MKTNRNFTGSNTSTHSTALRESALLPCATAHGKGQNTHDKKLYHVLHTAKNTRQIGVGKEAFCRVPFIGHTVKSLPSAKKQTTKNFLEN